MNQLEKIRKKLTYTLARAHSDDEFIAAADTLSEAVYDLHVYARGAGAALKVVDEIQEELRKTRERFDTEFDNQNTANDWIAYITGYVARAFVFPFDPKAFRSAMIKVAGLAISAIETLDRNGGKLSSRHYDFPKIKLSGKQNRYQLYQKHKEGHHIDLGTGNSYTGFDEAFEAAKQIETMKVFDGDIGIFDTFSDKWIR